jgi:hypothetical protein
MPGGVLGLAGERMKVYRSKHVKAGANESVDMGSV